MMPLSCQFSDRISSQLLCWGLCMSAATKAFQFFGGLSQPASYIWEQVCIYEIMVCSGIEKSPEGANLILTSLLDERRLLYGIKLRRHLVCVASWVDRWRRQTLSELGERKWFSLFFIISSCKGGERRCVGHIMYSVREQGT